MRVAFVPSSASGDDAPVRVAYAIGRRVGGAVVRNRLRRRLRAVLAEEAAAGGRLRPGDYLVAIAPEAADLPFSELRTLVTSALEALR